MKLIDILVADRDEQCIKSTRHALATKDYLRVVGEAHSSYEAVGKAYSCKPQVVLMDLSLEMPQAGLLALREIRNALADCCVIFYSSVSDKEMICRAYAEGAVNYMIKPAADAALVRAVVSAGRGASVISGDSAEILLEDYRRAKLLESNLGSLLKVAVTLTRSEMSILRLLTDGMQPGEIERVRFIEHSTMKTHLSHLVKKFGMDSISQVVEMLQSCGFFHFLDE